MASSSLKASPPLLAVWLDKHWMSMVFAKKLSLKRTVSSTRPLATSHRGSRAPDMLAYLIGMDTAEHKDLLDLTQAQCF